MTSQSVPWHLHKEFLHSPEVWNIYLAILIDHAPARAPQLVVYQKNNNFCKQPVLTHGLVEVWHAFCTLAASDLSLRWDVRFTSLWLECFWGTPAPMIHWPCVHCGATAHYPENCLFCAQSMHEPRRGPHALPPQHPLEDSTHYPCQVMYPTLDNPVTSKPNMAQPSHQRAQRTYHAFNSLICHRSSCNFLRLCEICGANHSSPLSSNKDSSTF